MKLYTTHDVNYTVLETFFLFILFRQHCFNVSSIYDVHKVVGIHVCGKLVRQGGNVGLLVGMWNE